jgi:predicted molibdopterin-dependent oxidoreductase YjgC
VDVCPTGALIDTRSAFMARPEKVERVATICTQCSLGCGLNVVMHRGQVLRLESLWEAPVNGGLLCRKGRFEALADGRTRLLQPLLKDNGRLAPVTWETALAVTAERLSRSDPERTGVFTTTRLTNEALGISHRIFVQPKRAAHRAMSNGEAFDLGPVQAARLADLAESDLILVAGADPAEQQPVASFLIRRAVDRGARLLTAGNRPNGLTAFAEAHFRPQEIELAAEHAQSAARPIVVYGEQMKKAEADVLCRLDGRTRFIALHPGVNTRTAGSLGLNGRFNPAACETLFIAAGDENGALDALRRRVAPDTFVVALSCYASDLTTRADVVLPMATWLERSGTFTNTEGSVLRAHAALPPAGQSRPDWDILGRLAENLGLEG